MTPRLPLRSRHTAYRLPTPPPDLTDRACAASHRLQRLCVTMSGLRVHFLSSSSSKSVSTIESRARTSSAHHKAMRKGGASAYA